MIATVDVADMGILSTLRALRRRPTPIDVPGLRWLDVAPTVPLSSKRPPGLRQAVLLAMWDDENAAASFADTHPLAQLFADNGFHAVLRPLRAFGTWPGLPDDVPRTRVTQHNGPVIVTTLGRLRMSQTLRFLRASRPAERAALKADGLVWGTAASRPARRPFMSTVSVWSSDEAATAYAYADAARGTPTGDRAATAQGLPPRIRLHPLRHCLDQRDAPRCSATRLRVPRGRVTWLSTRVHLGNRGTQSNPPRLPAPARPHQPHRGHRTSPTQHRRYALLLEDSGASSSARSVTNVCLI